MTSQAPAALVLSRQFAAPPQRVFEAWTTPELMKQWFGPAPDIRAELAEVDLRVGGAYRIGFAIPEGPMPIVEGTFREVDPPRRLVYTWKWRAGAEHPNVDTCVTVEFNEANGGTQLTLTHELFNTDDMREKHSTGWTGCIDQLSAFLS